MSDRQRPDTLTAIFAFIGVMAVLGVAAVLIIDGIEWLDRKTDEAAEEELLEDETARVEARATQEAKEKVDAHPEVVGPICEDASALGEEAAFENFKAEYTTDRAPPIRYVFDEALSRCK